ncbi:unnamed protein product, partial [Arctia plantaginis]
MPRRRANNPKEGDAGSPRAPQARAAPALASVEHEGEHRAPMPQPEALARRPRQRATAQPRAASRATRSPAPATSSEDSTPRTPTERRGASP